MIRFFVDGTAKTGDTVSLKPEDGKHLVKVLRREAGAELEVILDGKVFLGRLRDTQEPAQVLLVKQLDVYREAPLQVFLLQGMAKGERMDMVIQKAVELGAQAVVPVACRRSVVQLKGDKAKDKQKRWQKIAEAAAKQCGRQRITEIMPVSSLAQAIAALPPDTLLIMPWEEAGSGAEEQSLKAALAGQAPAAVGVIIGPEGGLTEQEVALAKERGAKIVTLGKRILRTETAAIVMLAALMYQWGDIGGQLS